MIEDDENTFFFNVVFLVVMLLKLKCGLAKLLAFKLKNVHTPKMCTINVLKRRNIHTNTASTRASTCLYYQLFTDYVVVRRLCDLKQGADKHRSTSLSGQNLV